MALSFDDALCVNLVREFDEATGEYVDTDRYEIVAPGEGTHALVGWTKWEEGVHAADDKDELMESVTSMEEGMTELGEALVECQEQLP